MKVKFDEIANFSNIARLSSAHPPVGRLCHFFLSLLPEFYSKFNLYLLPVYTCHGHWQDNQTTFIIAKHAGSQHGVCISYKPNELNAAQLIIGDSCYRPSIAQSVDHRLVANLTVIGKCPST
jgi:hypothetical protein